MKDTKFSRLLVLNEAGLDKHGNAIWNCLCDCGNKVIIPGQSLRSGNSKSCGKCPLNYYTHHGDYTVGTLTTGEEFMFDTNDFPVVSPHRWSYHDGYVRNQVYSGKNIFLHTLLFLPYSAEKNVFVAHNNHNGLDNRRANLRLATKSQINMIRKAPVNNTSGYKGVSYMATKRKFRARIKVNGKEHHLGLFETAELAAIAYDEAAFKLHGEFAYLNNPIIEVV
jgi:hypothetical protein